ncbi:hypothetical protein BaRGS_00034849 [Batillaria attramentaria]|uniref:Uncharacterized protein n=1 Tax=Batillaria attramentaria TaxID=370345 RepID=A0ABD0JGA1_9CAEN
MPGTVQIAQYLSEILGKFREQGSALLLLTSLNMHRDSKANRYIQIQKGDVDFNSSPFQPLRTNLRVRAAFEDPANRSQSREAAEDVPASNISPTEVGSFFFSKTEHIELRLIAEAFYYRSPN